MIDLKGYQVETLKALREFLRQCSLDGRPEGAFRTVQEKRGRQPAPYLPVSSVGLTAGMPYVCVKVPTGGGKTLLGCHSVGIAMRELLHADRTLALWLVPNNTILDQTVSALRDVRHPYRRALELGCGSVDVITVDDALRIPRASVDGQTVVIVSTIQAFRTEETADRKVYSQAGALADHFANIPADRVADLQRGPDGKPIPSLVNVLRLRRPIVIVDEAHNARTDLSFEMLGSISPSCIIEFTATPARRGHPSNVLHQVSAAELKAADMVKLPLRVISRHPSQSDQLLAEAVTLRAALEKIAAVEGQQTGKYLRPLMLLQAENVESCEPLREKLTSEHGVPKDQIKISVGRLDELKDVGDINSQKCPVRFIITVEKLREGWDCPFAYVLCSLKTTRSVTAIEQIVGRILRLPGATAKQHPDLNCSYAFSVSPSIADVLAELRDALESNGFTQAEAARIIIPVPEGAPMLGVQPQTVTIAAGEMDAAAVSEEVEALGGKVKLDVAKGEITVIVPLDDGETKKIEKCLKTPEAKYRFKQAVLVVREAERAFGGSGETRAPSPYERQVNFRVPLLCVSDQGGLLEFDSTFLLEQPWKLSSKDASVDGYDPRNRPAGRAGLVDVGTKGQVQTSVLPEGAGSDFVATLHQQVLSLGGLDDWTFESLVSWLDWRIEHQDIPAGEMAAFLQAAVKGLMTKHGITDIGVVALDRFRLRDELDRLIQKHREDERKKAFQMFLLPKSELAVSDERAVDYRTMPYDPSWYYEGGHQFKKHYFPKVGELLEKTPAGHQTEEFKCAQFLDDLPEVKHWVRNLARKTSSFKLLTSQDWFYPDFIAELQDGRIIVVEYKGQHLYAGAEEKRLVGKVWESRSKGKCLFAMPTDGDFSVIKRLISDRPTRA